MVLFFDLSIPYLEREGAPATENKARRDVRLKAVVKAMELGYTAVAYDRLHPGGRVLADTDRCGIPPFPLSALLRAAPALAASAAFHRSLLGASKDSPFRQYSRLTVAVDGENSAATLRPARYPVLRTYDLVAARPLNQRAFDAVCQSSEVDIIALDFSQRLPFRLKYPMVEAAIKRGLHFEITYSHLIADVHVRRQMLSDAKLLVDWTRGKNIIISGAATTANEIRGPCDVTNLSVFLLGLSMERAKAAISGNCRSLVATALRKKYCYKEAIRIERIVPSEQLDSKRVWSVDWKDWDPISSGDGDLPSLDEMSKFFFSARELPKSSTAIDFTSLAAGTPYLFGHNDMTISSPKDLEPSAFANEIPSATIDDVMQQGSLEKVPVENWTPMTTTPLKPPMPISEGILISPGDVEILLADAKESDPTISVNEDVKSSKEHRRIFNAANMPFSNAAMKDCHITCDDNVMSANASLSTLTTSKKTEPSDISVEDHEDSDPFVHVLDKFEASKGAAELIDSICSVAGDHILVQDGVMGEDLPEGHVAIFEQEQKDENLSANGISLQKGIVEPSTRDHWEGVIPLVDDEILKDGFENKNGQQEGVVLVGKDALVKDIIFNIEERIGSAAPDGLTPCKIKSGKRRRKERPPYPLYPLPFKALFRPMLFKKKAWQFRRSSEYL